jgi:hypothetical protein
MVGQSHVTPLYNPHPVTGDDYPPYSKSASLVDWFESAPPQEPIIVCLDPDMMLFGALDIDVTPEALKGRPIGQYYPMGTEVLRKLINLPGFCERCAPYREANLDQFEVGTPYVVHRDDFKELAPLWKYYTEKIRQDPVARETAQWLVDMYSYQIAVMELGLEQQLRQDWMVSWGNSWMEAAFVRPENGWDWKAGAFAKKPFYSFHYCQDYRVGTGWKFDKHFSSAHNYDLLKCGRRWQPPPAEIDAASFDQGDATTSPGDPRAEEYMRTTKWMADSLATNLNEAAEWYDAHWYTPDEVDQCKVREAFWADMCCSKPASEQAFDTSAAAVGALFAAEGTAEHADTALLLADIRTWTGYAEAAEKQKFNEESDLPADEAFGAGRVNGAVMVLLESTERPSGLHRDEMWVQSVEHLLRDPDGARAQRDSVSGIAFDYREHMEKEKEKEEKEKESGNSHP